MVFVILGFPGVLRAL